MRVIAGSARGTRLTAPRGTEVRPTADRARETLFNVLMPLLPRQAVLDLFAGCGGLGIEALSRGVEHGTFVERQRRTRAALGANLERCHLRARARVLGLDCHKALRLLAREGEQYDLLLIDPPYATELGVSALTQAAELGVAMPAAVAVLEHARCKAPSPLVEGWRPLRQLSVGQTGFVIFEYVGAAGAC